MDKQRISAYHTQLSRIYCLGILHIILSIAGLMLNYLSLNQAYLYFCIIGLNIAALFAFEPWKIMGYLNKGYEYKQGLEALGEVLPNDKVPD